jgi:hypothetical protein
VSSTTGRAAASSNSSCARRSSKSAADPTRRRSASSCAAAAREPPVEEHSGTESGQHRRAVLGEQDRTCTQGAVRHPGGVHASQRPGDGGQHGHRLPRIQHIAHGDHVGQ